MALPPVPSFPPLRPAAIPLRQLVYASAATEPDAPGLLEDVLAVSRHRNRAAGLTGLLIHHAGAFLQCLEGPAPAVDAAMARIRQDPRHANIEVLLDTTVETRSFAAWDMACTTVTASRWLDLATAEWEFNRDTQPTRPDSLGLALLERVWTEHSTVDAPWQRLDPPAG